MDLSKKSQQIKKIYTSILNYSLIIILLSISIWIPFRGYFLGIVLLIPLIDLNKKDFDIHIFSAYFVIDSS